MPLFDRPQRSPAGQSGVLRCDNHREHTRGRPAEAVVVVRLQVSIVSMKLDVHAAAPGVNPRTSLRATDTLPRAFRRSRRQFADGGAFFPSCRIAPRRTPLLQTAIYPPAEPRPRKTPPRVRSCHSDVCGTNGPANRTQPAAEAHGEDSRRPSRRNQSLTESPVPTVR